MPDIASTTIANRQPIICSLSCRASRTFRFLKIALRGRPELKACHAFLDAGDMVAELRERGIGFTSLHENLDTTTPGGRLGGRPSVATEEVIRAARDLLPDSGRSITSIAKLLGVSPGTLYNHIPDLRELRAGAVPRQLEAPAN